MPTRATNPLPLCFALLRGVNVGGKCVVSKADLHGIFEGLGVGGVETYLNSGNVVFRGPRTEAELDAVAARAERAIEKRLGRPIRVIVRTPAEMRKVAAKGPFPEADPSRVQVVFCDRKGKGTLEAARSPADSFIVAGREVYLSCPAGLSKTKFTLDYVERTLGVAGTGRNWNTVRALAEWNAAGE